MGGGSVMVCGAFVYDGKCDLQRVPGKMDSIFLSTIVLEITYLFWPILGGDQTGNNSKTMCSVMCLNELKTGF